MLTVSQQYFITILRDFLNQRESISDESANWEEIAGLAEIHQVSGIVHYQCRANIPVSIGLDYASERQFYNYAQYKKAAEDLEKSLGDIPHIFVKGIGIAELYPVPALRSMGDLDLLIQKKDRDAVEGILSAFGYYFEQCSESVGVFYKGSVTVELHDSLIHSGIGNENARMLFSDPWSNVRDGELDWSYHLLFLLQHLKGHMVSHGVGIRQFMDIAVVIQNKTIDWTWMIDQLSEAKMLRFAKRVFSLVYDWFGIKAPDNMILTDEEFFLAATSKILSDGVFGHDNNENNNSEVVKKLLNEGGTVSSVRRQYLLCEMFPEYRKMCGLPYCKYVNKSPLLLPVAWVHRILYRAIDKTSRKQFIERTMVSDTKVQERMEMFQKWGIEP